MTKNEAIEFIVQSVKDDVDIAKVAEAIQALEQQPSEDCISREAAIDALWKALYEYEDKTEKQFLESEELDVANWFQHRIFVQNMSDIDRQTILNLPSVTPKFTDSEIQKMQELEQAQLEKAYELGKAEMQPCEDCISRTALLAKIDEERKHLLALKMDGAEHILVHHARRIIEELPTVIPKVGHWTYCPDDNGEFEEYPACWCSQCFEYAPILPNDKIARYCPNCGCRMVE